jgi:hypothetical protein
MVLPLLFCGELFSFSSSVLPLVGDADRISVSSAASYRPPRSPDSELYVLSRPEPILLYELGAPTESGWRPCDAAFVLTGRR